MDVRTKAQEQNQDLEHGLHVKLSDDELDENALLPLLEKTESFKERVVTSSVKVVRSELDVLNTRSKFLVNLILL
ncbi:hypothetical protein V8E54_010241 [Elaphomyces granulatus]